MRKIIQILLLVFLFNPVLAQTSFLDSIVNVADELEKQGQLRKAVEVLRASIDQLIDINPLDASQCAAMAKQKAEKLGDSTLIALTMNDMGRTYMAQKTYFMATDLFFKAYYYFLKVNDQKNIAYTLLNIGNAYLMQGMEDIAESKFQESKKIFEQLNDSTGIANSLFYLGQANLKTDEDKAVEYFDRAIDLFTTLGDSLKIAKTRYYLSEAYFGLGETDKAFGELNKALGYFSAHNKTIEVAKSFLLMSRILLERNQYDSALAFAFDAENIFARYNSNEKLAETYLQIAQVYKAIGDLEKAIVYAGKSVDMSQMSSYLEVQSLAYNLLAECYEEQKDYQNALEFQKLYTQSLEQLYQQNKMRHFSSFQMNLETQNNQKKIEMLQIQAEKERLKLAKEQYRRNFIYILIIAFLSVLFVVFLITRMREKIKITRLLENTNTKLTKEIEIRKKTELQLKNSEERYRLLFRKTPIGIMQYDENLVIIDANDRFAEIFKVPRKSIVNNTLDKIFDRNVMIMLKEALDKNDEIFGEQIEILTKEGVVYVTMTIKPYVFNNGEQLIKSAIVIAQDITKHKKTEELYKRNFVSKQKMLELIPDSLILLEPDGTIIDAHLPHSPDKEFGVRNIEELLPPKAIKLFRSEIDIALERKHLRRFFFTTGKGKSLLARIVPDDEKVLIIISQLPDSEGEFRDSKVNLLDKSKLTAKQKLMRELEHSIENELIPVYQNLQRALSFIMLKTFIERVDSVSQRFNLQELALYKDKLNDALVEFDVPRVNEILSEFPSIISKYIGYESVTF